MDYISRAQEVIAEEIAGLQTLSDGLESAFSSLVTQCLATLRAGGKLVLCGVGKSGLIGRKMAATLASTGSQAVFLHPVEAMHGDLGLLSRGDLLLCLSYSGETDELLAVLPAVRRFDIPIVGITGNPDSRLGSWSQLVVPMPVPGEACPFNLAPTTSTTALLALGDALAIVLMEARGFSKEDYGKLHPAGAIGRTITMTIGEVMRGPERTAAVTRGTSVKDALMQMTACRSGSVLVVEQDGKLAGIFTDGDFRRHAQQNMNILEVPICQVMTPNPLTLRPEQLAVDMLTLLEHHQIDDVPVVDDAGQVAGIVDIQDLPRFKLMIDPRE